MGLIVKIITAVFTSLMYIGMWKVLLDKKVNYKSIKTYIAIALFSIIILLNFLYNNQYIRIAIITLVFMPFIKFFFKEKLSVCAIIAILSQIIDLISEMIFAFIMGVLFNKVNELDLYMGELFTIWFLYGSNYLMVRIPIFKKIKKFMEEKVENISNKFFIIFSIVLLIVYNYFISVVYYKIDVVLLGVINTIIIIIYAILVFKFLITKSDYNEISNKYVNSISSLKEYEDIMDKYRVLNHENKNQLLTIRAMILKKEDKIPEYIDTIINTTIIDSENLMFETNKIPAGGLRAIIYSKMTYMQSKNINVTLDIEKHVRTVELINLDDKLVLDICKIIGVFLDNAIEEVENIDKKEVIIQLYVEENDLCIAITNNIKSKLEINKIDNKGYTTKEKGHGYGLTLVKNIISLSKGTLENERNIYEDKFTQVLRIKNVK